MVIDEWTREREREREGSMEGPRDARRRLDSSTETGEEGSRRRVDSLEERTREKKRSRQGIARPEGGGGRRERENRQGTEEERYLSLSSLFEGGGNYAIDSWMPSSWHAYPLPALLHSPAVITLPPVLRPFVLSPSLSLPLHHFLPSYIRAARSCEKRSHLAGAQLERKKKRRKFAMTIHRRSRRDGAESIKKKKKGLECCRMKIVDKFLRARQFDLTIFAWWPALFNVDNDLSIHVHWYFDIYESSLKF